MATTISPANYGLLPYGIASYASYISSQSPIIVVSPPLVMESLVTALIPADVKVYFSVQE